MANAFLDVVEGADHRDEIDQGVPGELAWLYRNLIAVGDLLCLRVDVRNGQRGLALAEIFSGGGAHPGVFKQPLVETLLERFEFLPGIDCVAAGKRLRPGASEAAKGCSLQKFVNQRAASRDRMLR